MRVSSLSPALTTGCPVGQQSSRRLPPARPCAKKQDAGDAPKEKAPEGIAGLANRLLYNAASLITQRGETYCIRCQGTGRVECPACKGAGIVAPEKVRGVSQVRAAASKVQSLIFKEPATFRDDDWIKTNRCKRCRATGYITCPACDGAGKRGPKS